MRYTNRRLLYLLYFTFSDDLQSAVTMRHRSATHLVLSNLYCNNSNTSTICRTGLVDESVASWLAAPGSNHAAAYFFKFSFFSTSRLI